VTRSCAGALASSRATSEERELLVRAIDRVTGQAANAIVDEAMATGLEASDKIVISTKMLRAELLSVKADLEREMEKVVLDCGVREARPLRRRSRRQSRTLGARGTRTA
jgi:hypothetical protein